jgi:hypothetical protein
MVQATPNCYKVQKPEDFIRIKDQVTFTTPDPVKFPLPSPILLASHAACAQVAQLSGFREGVKTPTPKAEVFERPGSKCERKPRVVGVPLAFPFAYKLIRVSISKGVSIYLSVHYWSGLS